jgi:hypothetical protein
VDGRGRVRRRLPKSEDSGGSRQRLLRTTAGDEVCTPQLVGGNQPPPLEKPALHKSSPSCPFPVRAGRRSSSSPQNRTPKPVPLWNRTTKPAPEGRLGLPGGHSPQPTRRRTANLGSDGGAGSGKLAFSFSFLPSPPGVWGDGE